MGSEKRKNRRRHLERQAAEKAKRLKTSTDDNTISKGAGYPELIKENKNFDAFYQTQGIVPPEEWSKFSEILRQSLPSTFRITQYRNDAKMLLKVIESDYFAKLTSTDEEESNEESPKFFPLPWYPNKLAWQVNLSRQEIRRNEACQRLHNFLISETSSGNISRQEAVSMIPPLILDVQPHHKVLDMCAAPGSKTAQLIEMLHVDDKTIPDGVVIANDADNKRCYMLVHQTKRLQSPCLIITNHDAGVMPNIQLEDGKNLKFDRILCDVPCSGDGTLRKNADVWPKWNLGNIYNFHVMQARILKRGLELLEIGGKLVYSTCSMCPIEDESVIHHMLSLCGDSVELVDASDRVPGLKYRQGVSHWLVMNQLLEIIPTPEEIPQRNKSHIKSYMFPPAPEDAHKYNLDRCIRVLPHLQNTGGFFVALLRKVKPLPWESNKKSGGDAENNGTLAQGAEEASPEGSTRSERKKQHAMNKKLRRKGCYREDPFLFLDADDPIWPNIQNVYDIGPSFDNGLLMTRTAVGKKKTLYFTSKAVKEIITLNIEKIKVINTGIKLFCRCDTNSTSATGFRLTQEGLPIIFPYLKSRIVNLTKDDVIKVLSTNFPTIDSYSDHVKTQLESYKESGSLALSYTDTESEEKQYFVLCGWKGVATLRAYISKDERVHYLRLCGVDVSQFEIKTPEDEKAEIEGDKLDDNQEVEPINKEAENDVKNVDDQIKHDDPLKTEETS
ncbi:hypothetical protein CHUAL_013107 [Chamberlinius hualienensis]